MEWRKEEDDEQGTSNLKIFNVMTNHTQQQPHPGRNRGRETERHRNEEQRKT